MEIVVFLLVVIAAPIGLLLWTRRGRHPGDPANDQQGHRNIGTGGPPLHSQQGWPPDNGAGGS